MYFKVLLTFIAFKSNGFKISWITLLYFSFILLHFFALKLKVDVNSIQVLYSQINLKLKSVLSLLIWIDLLSFLNKMINCRHICLLISKIDKRVISYYNLSENELMKVWSNLRIGSKFNCLINIIKSLKESSKQSKRVLKSLQNSLKES